MDRKTDRSYIKQNKTQETIQRNRAFLTTQATSLRELYDGPALMNIANADKKLV